MNIFKTLASGSGSINEPNVSAFLGYLLNPKEDHGLGDTFLRKFLKPLLEQNDNLEDMRDRNLSIRSNFEMEVLLEQAFPNDGVKKEVVDIVILCYKKESQQGQFLAENIIKEKQKGDGNPKHIFLIENKIQDSSTEQEQLERQFKQTVEKLDKMGITNSENLVSVIFVTPEGKKSKEEFENFKKTNNSCCRLLWHTEKGDSISKFIKDIINEASKPIDAYCKYTLQAFLEFIESDFKSTIKEELEAKKDYQLEWEDDSKKWLKVNADKLLSAIKEIDNTNAKDYELGFAKDYISIRRKGQRIYSLWLNKKPKFSLEINLVKNENKQNIVDLLRKENIEESKSKDYFQINSFENVLVQSPDILKKIHELRFELNQ